MRASLEDVRIIADQAANMVAADQAEAVVVSTTSALTRFANNRIHQNMTDTDTQVSIRAVLGTRVGVASTNRTDGESLARCATAAAEAARRTPEDPGFPGLPGPAPIVTALRTGTGTSDHGADQRAEAARSIIEQSEARGLVAAGTVAVSDSAVAVANTRGVLAAMETDSLRATVLSMGTGGASGWASFLTNDAASLSPASLGGKAATIAERSADPVVLPAGCYPVVLAPEAVADILDFLGYVGFGARAFAEGSSFMSASVGAQVMDGRISIADNALSPGTVGLTFDFEGQPKHTTPLIEGGVAVGPVTDSYYAHALGLPNTGHALPAPNPYGPMPLNLEMAAGDVTEADMIASVERGVYVTRFHYVNVEDPMKVVLTGMTRDGTFLIEDGELTSPVRSLRFTQSALEALVHVGAVGSHRALIGPGDGGATLVPALLLEHWEFTGQTG